MHDLDAYHRMIRAGIDEIRLHCERFAPDLGGLASARFRLSQVSANRSTYVHDVLVPRLRQDATDKQLDELRALLRNFSKKRLASSEHVTRWTSKTIAEDWNGYRAAARLIWAMMEEQMRQERRVFWRMTLDPPTDQQIS